MKLLGRRAATEDPLRSDYVVDHRSPNQAGPRGQAPSLWKAACPAVLGLFDRTVRPPPSSKDRADRGQHYPERQEDKACCLEREGPGAAGSVGTHDNYCGRQEKADESNEDAHVVQPKADSLAIHSDHDSCWTTERFRSVSRRRTASKPRLVTKGKGRRTALARPEIAPALFDRFTQRASLSPRTSEKRPVDATRAAEVPETDLRLEPARQARLVTRPAETTRTPRRAARKPLRGTTHRGAICASSAPRSRPCG